MCEREPQCLTRSDLFSLSSVVDEDCVITGPAKQKAETPEDVFLRVHFLSCTMVFQVSSAMTFQRCLSIYQVTPSLMD